MDFLYALGVEKKSLITIEPRQYHIVWQVKHREHRDSLAIDKPSTPAENQCSDSLSENLCKFFKSKNPLKQWE